MNGMNQLRRLDILSQKFCLDFPFLNNCVSNSGLESVPLMSLGLWTWSLCELGGHLFSVDINPLS